MVVATVARTEYGIHIYPDAQNILLLCDASGANSYRHHIFKNKLLELTKEIGIFFIVAHYPPHTAQSGIQSSIDFFVMFIMR